MSVLPCRLLTALSVLAAAAVPLPAQAAGFDAASISLMWCLPFALLLLSIALCPLLAPHIWHRHFGKITFTLTLLFLLPFTAVFGWRESLETVVHAVVAEYIPFILLLLSLFVISGGIFIDGRIKGNPGTNTALLALGTALASVMGTTGAAMLLIRPLLRANANRRYRVHTVVFFIFLVANIGGGLTPLGDPPLFLGFLKGVSFGWTVEHMLLPVLLNSIILLAVFFFLDRFLARKENKENETTGNLRASAENNTNPIRLIGKKNFWLLGGVVAAVLISGVWKSPTSFEIFGTEVPLPVLLRDIAFVLLAVVSLLITPKQARSGNSFDWEPIKEVAKLFAGIFITISPVIAILKSGEAGHFAPLVRLVDDTGGAPVDSLYFWMTGLLSAFLDNAPTYLVFFNLAGGDASELMTTGASTLLAVSMGSVFMGALSYIGNAPNFMVKAIAERQNVRMPGFFGYMLWSFGVLLPLFLLDTLIFFC